MRNPTAGVATALRGVRSKPRLRETSAAKKPEEASLEPSVSILATASTLPEAIVSNHDIGQRLLDGVEIDDEESAEIVARIRERAELIEKKTGLRARGFDRFL